MRRTTWEKRVEKFCQQLAELCREVPSSDPYGVDNADLGLWCEDCAPADAWSLNAGWDSSDDGQRFCQTCDKILDHGFTDWGTKEEIGYSAQEQGPITPSEAFTLYNLIECGHPRLTCPCGDFECLPELKPQLRVIMKRMDLTLETKNA